MSERKLNEPELPDDYPIFAGYLYVADGKVVESHLHGVTAKRLKQELGAKELRRCDITGRQELLKVSP